MTVLDLIKKYLSQKTGVQHNTEANHNFVLNIIKKEDFGRQRIDRVKLSDAKCWLIKLQQDGRGYSSIYIEDTKTSSGTREIPMMDDVYQCFQRIIANRSKPKAEPMLVGRCDFLYLGKNGKLMVALHLGALFQAHLPEVQQHLPSADAQSHPARLQAHILFQHGKERYEPQDAAIPHGPFRYWRHAEHLYPLGLCGCAGGAGTGRQRRVVKRDKPP